MKKYSIDSLKVVKICSGDSVRYLICKYNELTETYIEILTNEKIKIDDESCVEPLSNYYSVLSIKNYLTGESLMLDKKMLLKKYIDINKKDKDNIEEDLDKDVLDRATINFFPKDGTWYSDCFKRSNEFEKVYLPCNLRNDWWLAKMLERTQPELLFSVKSSEILNYVKTSEFFKQKRHEYELEIVKWQINFIKNGGEGWICSDDCGIYSPSCDIVFRKGVVDTLFAIGMNREVIEEGIEKNANLWRKTLMKMAFSHKYEPVFYLAKVQVGPAEEEHKEKWLKMRKYEYYQQHKESVDKYGVIEPGMIMTFEEVDETKKYLEQKHVERMNQIEEVKKGRQSILKFLQREI